MSNQAQPQPFIAPVPAGRRRRYTPEQKRRLLDETLQPGQSVSEVARRYGVAPSVLFKWRQTMDDAAKQGLRRNEKVVPESEVRELRERIADLERALGRKAMEVEILRDMLEEAEEKKRRSPARFSRPGGGT